MSRRNVVIATGQRIEDATLVGLGTLAPELPVEHLQTYQPGEVARWLTLGTIGVEADLGEPVAVNVVAFGPHNGTAAATCRFRGAAPSTNVFLYSEEIDNAAWIKDEATVVANAIAAPDGSMTADKLVDTASNTAHMAYQAPVPVTVSQVLTISVFAKHAGRDIALTAFGEGLAAFNLTAGTIIQTGGHVCAITDAGGGWWRCSASIVKTDITNGNFYIGLWNGGSPYAGDGVSGAYIWGAQLSLGNTLGSYAKTTATADEGVDFDVAAQYDSGVISAWPATGRPTGHGYEKEMLWSFFYLPTAQLCQNWRLDIFDAANPAGYFDVGRLYITDAWRPSIGAKVMYAKGWLDPSNKYEAVGGQTWVYRKNRSRQLDFTLGYMEQDEIEENAYEIQRRRGTSQDVLICRDPFDTTHLHRNLVYGFLEELPPIVNSVYKLFESRFRLLELIR